VVAMLVEFVSAAGVVEVGVPVRAGEASKA
jgi:hypothetical protein